MKHISIVTPCHNEESNVRELHAAIRKVFAGLPQYSYEHLYIDNAYVSTTACDDISSTCQLGYSWSPNGVGQHTATFKSYDWLGNVGVLTTTFTVT